MLVISFHHRSFWQPDNSLPFTDIRPILSRVFCRESLKKNLSINPSNCLWGKEKKIASFSTRAPRGRTNAIDEGGGLLFPRLRSKVDHGSRFGRGMQRLHSFEPVISRKEEAEWKSVNPRGETRVANDRFRPRSFHSPRQTERIDD